MVSTSLYYEEQLDVLLVLHVVISFVVSYLISVYALKRFKKSTETIDERDKLRIEQIKDKSFIYKFFFKVSLHKHNQLSLFLFSFLFNLSIPLLGYFFTLWIFWYMVNVKYAEKLLETNVLNFDEFSETFLKVERLFGEGSMINIMSNNYVSKSHKVKALSSLLSDNSPVSLQIVKETLASPDDEIRMFGYAIINKAEKALNKKINENLALTAQELEKGDKKDEETIAFAARELAYLYWEMVYTELSHDSLKMNFLNSVVTYLDIAKDYYIPKIDQILLQIKESEKNPYSLKNTNETRKEKEILEETYLICSTLFSLMGRVYIYRKEFEKAKAEFTVAKEILSKRSTFLIPYLAEIYFLTGKYDIVASLLKQTKGLQYNAKLYPIIRQWEDAS